MRKSSNISGRLGINCKNKLHSERYEYNDKARTCIVCGNIILFFFLFVFETKQKTSRIIKK